MKKVFNFICCGSVDDGKSTLIGRLLTDTNNVKKDQLEDALRASSRIGSDKLEFSMLLDGLLSEREQQITIDIAHRYFDWEDVRFHIFDCPGHQQYTKNMAIAAAMVDTAVLVVDCVRGVSEQTRRHIEICHKFNLKNICCCLTKIDLLPDSKEAEVVASLTSVLKEYESWFDKFEILPISSVAGVNVSLLLDKLVEYSRKEKQKPAQKIFYVHAVKLFEGNRYYYVLPMGDVEPEVGEKYYIYAQDNKPLVATISDVLGYGCFKIEEDIDIQQGDVFAEKELVGSYVLKHETIWFDEPTNDMLIKQGTRLAKIVSVTPEVLNVDRLLFVSDIKSVKENSLGIIIDNLTKKTLGCAIFRECLKEKDTSLLGNEIVFDKTIVSEIGMENIFKVQRYLQEHGYNVSIEE